MVVVMRKREEVGGTERKKDMLAALLAADDGFSDEFLGGFNCRRESRAHFVLISGYRIFEWPLGSVRIVRVHDTFNMYCRLALGGKYASMFHDRRSYDTFCDLLYDLRSLYWRPDVTVSGMPSKNLDDLR
ncbi:unnamed protein product [Cochlearia groenlandica]